MARDAASSSDRAGEQGFAVLAVLVLTATLALLATELLASSRADLREAAAELRRAGLQAAADGAIAEGIFHSLDGSADRWRADGMPHRWEQDGTRLELLIANARAVDLPGPAAPPPPEDRITLVATALGAQGGLFIRRAVVDLAAGPAGSMGRIRTWETSHH